MIPIAAELGLSPPGLFKNPTTTTPRLPPLSALARPDSPRGPWSSPTRAPPRPPPGDLMTTIPQTGSRSMGSSSTLGSASSGASSSGSTLAATSAASSSSPPSGLNPGSKHLLKITEAWVDGVLVFSFCFDLVKLATYG
ncbi:retinoic acid receptor RXR-beta-like isoform X1 [Triticum urartu]|uniref:retinoic acid receptor RXR-beta-like isoform X1 n=1 Tax=Triticum urartu TaxID=4572 RepID=UPI002043E44D|nr:retinoic acid receptor RXR-beta-like isoform X1 [Triticum urartu]